MVNCLDWFLLIWGVEIILFYEWCYGIGGLLCNNNVYGFVIKWLYDIGISFWYSLYCIRFWYGKKSWCGRIDWSELKKIWFEKGSVSLFLFLVFIVNGC